MVFTTHYRYFRWYIVQRNNIIYNINARSIDPRVRQIIMSVYCRGEKKPLISRKNKNEYKYMTLKWQSSRWKKPRTCQTGIICRMWERWCDYVALYRRSTGVELKNLCEITFFLQYCILFSHQNYNNNITNIFRSLNNIFSHKN